MEDLPFFITGPAQTDILFNITIVFLLAVVMALGNLYFQLHALPERMAHGPAACSWRSWRCYA